MSSAGIGAKLHDARERAGLSLRQVADATKIASSLLQAIERNDISRLPGGLYSRGYVRSFAVAVALDPEAVVAEFVAQFPEGSVKDGYPAAERAAMEESQQRKPRGASAVAAVRAGLPMVRRIATLGGLPAAIVIYVGTSGVAPWTMRPVGPTGHERIEVRQAGLVDVFVGASSAAATSALPAKPIETAPLRPLPSRFMEIGVETISTPGPVVAMIDEAPAVPPTADNTFASGAVAIVLTASSPSWVIATVDGRKSVNRLLEPGSQETLEARRDLTLTLGDAGAVAMTLNGRPARPLGRSGEPATAYVTNANFRTYLRR